MRTLIAAAALVLALVLPQAAVAGPATITSRDLPLHGGRVLAGATPRFDLVGVHWRGSGGVELSTRSLDGRWSSWLSAAAEPDDLPDRGSREGAASRGWRVGSPIWTGPSTAIRYRTSGRVTALRAYFVRSPVVKVPFRAPAVAGAPPIVTRSAWGADESIRVGVPQYAASVRYAVVHHTAGTNAYTRAQAPAIVRGIELYHVKSNGWNDIGYNFLVDRFGTVYEGRYGGVDRNVVGAHAMGFNTGSVGVAVIGSFESTSIPAAARSSLAALLAWRLDLAHVDPLSTLSVVSSGSDRFPAGIPVFLRAVSGHRDTGLTACPGDALYAQLGAIAGETQAVGLPKLYEPRVTGALGGTVRFRARLSTALPVDGRDHRRCRRDACDRQRLRRHGRLVVGHDGPGAPRRALADRCRHDGHRRGRLARVARDRDGRSARPPSGWRSRGRPPTRRRSAPTRTAPPTRRLSSTRRMRLRRWT